MRRCVTWATENFQITRQQAFAEWQAFADYWTSKAGAGARKVDWFKTWCNWVRNSRKNYRPKNAEAALPPSLKKPLAPLVRPLDDYYEFKGGGGPSMPLLRPLEDDHVFKGAKPPAPLVRPPDDDWETRGGDQ